MIGFRSFVLPLTYLILSRKASVDDKGFADELFLCVDPYSYPPLPDKTSILFIDSAMRPNIGPPLELRS